MAEAAPLPPVELTNGVIVNKGDSASTESAKLRFQGDIDALQAQGITSSLTVYVDGTKAFGGVPT